MEKPDNRAAIVSTVHRLPAHNTTGKRHAEPDAENEEEERRAGEPEDQRAGRTDRLKELGPNHEENGGANKVAQWLQRKHVEKEEDKTGRRAREAAGTRPRNFRVHGRAGAEPQSTGSKHNPGPKGEKCGAEAKACLSRQAASKDAGGNSEPGDNYPRKSCSHYSRPIALLASGL